MIVGYETIPDPINALQWTGCNEQEMHRFAKMLGNVEEIETTESGRVSVVIDGVGYLIQPNCWLVCNENTKRIDVLFNDSFHFKYRRRSSNV